MNVKKEKNVVNHVLFIVNHVIHFEFHNIFFFFYNESWSEDTCVGDASMEIINLQLKRR